VNAVGAAGGRVSGGTQLQFNLVLVTAVIL